MLSCKTLGCWLDRSCRSTTLSTVDELARNPASVQPVEAVAVVAARPILQATRLSLTGVLPSHDNSLKVLDRFHLQWQHDISELRIQFFRSCILLATTKRVIHFVFPICNERKVFSTGRAAIDWNLETGNSEVCSSHCPPNTLACIVLPLAPCHSQE